MSLLSEYSDLADSAIDGLQDFLAQIDQVVDRTILTTSWAESEMRRIEAWDSSTLASINKLIIKIVGLPADVLYTQVEVREALSGLTGKVQVQVIKVLSEAQNVREILGKVKDVLDSIALAALGDSEVLRKEKVSQISYWQWILQSYRDKMADFDAKIEMFSAFCINTEKAITVVSTTTQLKMQQIKAELRVFRKGLQGAPFILGRDKAIFATVVY
jgi:hypothetical protein